jgi:hypothetical protein
MPPPEREGVSEDFRGLGGVADRSLLLGLPSDERKGSQTWGSRKRYQTLYTLRIRPYLTSLHQRRRGHDVVHLSGQFFCTRFLHATVHKVYNSSLLYGGVQ